MKKRCAIIDSSFFIHLIKIDLLNYFFNYYDKIIVPLKVEKEITFIDNLSSNIYTPKDILEFKRLKKENKIIIKNPKQINKKLKSQVSNDSGELYSIALSYETKNIVFIDNGRPYKFCKENNILVANIIEFILYLYLENKLTKKECYFKINLIKNSIPLNYLKDIDKYLESDNL